MMIWGFQIMPLLDGLLLAQRQLLLGVNPLLENDLAVFLK
jgi:hypothetical protein